MRAAKTEPPAVGRKWSDEAGDVVKTGLVGQSVWRGGRPAAVSLRGDRRGRPAGQPASSPPRGGSGLPAVFVGRGSRPGPPSVRGRGRQHVCARARGARAWAWGESALK